MNILHLISFYALLNVSFAKQPSILIPDLVGCNSTSNLLDFCKSKFNFCQKTKVGFAICSDKFIDCTKSIAITSDANSCKSHLEGVRQTVKRERNSEAGKKEIGLPPEIHRIVADIDKDCGLNLLDDHVPLTRLISLLTTDDCAKKYKSRMDDSVLELDKTAAKNLPIPFDRSRCGLQYGYIGKVIFRRWIAEECGDHAMNMNHCCAEHFNCYMNNIGKELCDERFTECQEKFVTTMVNYRTSCKHLSEELSKRFIPEENDYQVVAQGKFQTEINTFNDGFKESLQSTDIKSFNITDLKVFLLDSVPSLDHSIRETFNEKIYGSGWSQRVIIDSCALMFEESRRHEPMSICLKGLKICLDAITEKSLEFMNSIGDFSHKISQLESSLTRKEVKKIIEEKGWTWMEIILLGFEVIGGLIMIFGFLYTCWGYCRKSTPLSPPNAESFSMDNLGNRRGAERDGQENESREGDPLNPNGVSSSPSTSHQ